MKPITIISLVISVLCFIGAIIFHLLKSKGAILVSGFDNIPKNEQKYYYKEKISLDMRNSLLTWGITLLLGSIFAQFLHEYFGIGAIIIFFILVIHSLGQFDQYKFK